MKNEGIVLKANKHNNTCRIHPKDAQVNLENVVFPFGFEKNKIIPAGAYVDCGTVDVNLGLRYVTVGCDLVDGTRNLDRYQRPSDVIAVIPVTTEDSLNGWVTNLGAQKFSAPLRNGTNCDMSFYVKDNTLSQVAKLYVQFEVHIS